MPSLGAAQLPPPGNVPGRGGGTAFPSSSLRPSGLIPNRMRLPWGEAPNSGKGRIPHVLVCLLQGRGHFTLFPPTRLSCVQLVGACHPPLCAGCPGHFGDGHKSWLQNTDSGKRQDGEEELVRGRGQPPHPAPDPRPRSPLASSCDQLVMSESEMNSWLLAVAEDGPDRRLEPSARALAQEQNVSSTPFTGLGFTASSLSEFSGVVRNGNRSTVYLPLAASCQLGHGGGARNARVRGARSVCVHVCARV